MATSGKTQTVTFDGQTIRVSNLDKVMYPETGTTKGEIIAYYAEIAPVFIPHSAGRPATRKRWVHGVGTADEPGMVFFQKDLDDSAPDWVHRQVLQHKDHRNTYPLVDNAATLVWLAQIAALEIHVPQWQFGRDGRPRNPDRLVLDLDPGDGVGLPECAEVARLARRILDDMGLSPIPVTSGSKGIHLYAALDGSATTEQVAAVAHELARALEADHPDLVVSDMKKTLRTGKVLVDWSQNSGAKTTVAPYSLRGRARPTVAAPRTWGEINSPKLRQLEFGEVLERVRRRGDPLAGVEGSGESASAAASALAHSGAGADTAAVAASGDDLLATYRSKRDASKTPEPVPEAIAPAGSRGRPHDGSRFVIQEHHARALHHDFRLERDGVLVSWAVPKGIPATTGKNHLGIQTEDHPIEYADFSGTIPKGEYGAGTVSTWDSGHYELEKWRDDEIIATLHGAKDGGLGGDTRVALIRTGGSGEKSQWLVHRMKTPATKTFRPKNATGGSESRRTSHYAPMLATLGTEDGFGDETDWSIEMKWDGVRAIAHVDGDGCRLFTRNGHDVTDRYPEFATVGADLTVGRAVLDGEIVALDTHGAPDFGLVQQRLGLTKKAEITAAAERVPVEFYLFDVLELEGEPLVDEPYSSRRRALEGVLVAHPESPVSVPPTSTGGVKAAMRRSRERGYEGIIAKDPESSYRAGKRSGTWVKIKHQATQEVVVAGWRPGNGRRADTIGSLLLGIPGDDGLEYVGRVGTGFSDRDLERLQQTLAGMARKTSPLVGVPDADAADAHWVTASLVGEVSFAEWTDTGRLRQPAWRGLRPDKTAAEVVREISRPAAS